MKKAFKRTLAVFLTAVMVFGAAPLSGFVGLELPEFDLFSFKANADGTATSGTCGNNLTWTFDESTGELVISGTGDMYDWLYDTKPWYDIRSSIKSVTIDNSVTSIGDDAFSYCYNLTSVTIPDSVTSIGDSAFDDCDILSNVTIPDSVTSIGDLAFFDCHSLTSIHVDSLNTSYSSDEYGVLFNRDKTELIQYPIGNTRTSYKIPDSVTSIGDYAFFWCYNLTSVTIGNSVTSIGDFAFNGCFDLTNVTIGNSVTSIGYSAFYNCESLASITIPDSVTRIGDYAFYSCFDLTSVTIGNSVTSIGDGAFEDCYSLTSIHVDSLNTSYSSDEYGVLFNRDKTELIQYPIGNTRTSYKIPDSVTSIGDYAFCGCDSLASATIGNNVTSIGDLAFRYCDDLTDVYYTGTEDEWKAISIGSDNDYLTDATIHYNSNPEDGEAIPPAENFKTQSIKVMSYNVYVKDGDVKGITNGKTYDCSYGTRTRYIVQNINDNMPDSVGLQEVSSEMRTFLENFEDLNGGILSVNYAGVGEYRSKSGKNNEASLIYYNKNKFNLKESGTFWLSESGEKYSKHTDSEYPRICTYALLENKETGLQYLHINTHLEHDHSSEEGGSNDAAIFSSEKIVDFINKKFPNIPVVITGDFNQKKDSAPYNNFINAGYTDTRDVYSGNLNTYINSYNQGEDKKAYGAKVIDHVLVNEYFNNGIESYTVYNEDYSNSDKYGNLALDYPYPSDHHPIVVELKATYSGDIVSSKEIKFGENKSVEVVLDDDWFEKSNTEYNHAFAQFCSDYVMMGYCEDEEEMKSYLSQMGFDTVDSCMKAGRDEVNYFIASKDITVNGETETLVFAAFIGSYKNQWYSNFDPYATERDSWKNRNAPYADASEKGKVHLGFADAREYVYARLKEFIVENNINKDNMKLLLSGHSRGAATANLLAAKLIDEYYSNSSTATVSKDNLYTYTFATPNTASKEMNVFADKYKCIFNIVNPEDFVTKVMLNDWGYYRYGKTFVLSSRTNDTNWKKYLSAMQPFFGTYSGKTYDPYTMGEVKTTNIIKSMSKNVSTVDGLYSDVFTYYMSFEDGVVKKSPFEFFKLTLLKYLVDNNMDEIKKILLTCSVFYKNILQYFAWPDADLSVSLDESFHLSLYPTLEIGGKFKQAHQMETYCAYMNAMTDSQIRQTRLYYENTVNCPVDIEVYDNATNELVGKITNNVIDETVAAGENAIVMDVDGDSKSFWLPSNGDYRVVLSGNDDGTMDYTVSSIDSDTGETQRVNFFDVEIETGVSMEGEFEGEEFDLDEYTLTHEANGIVEPDEKLDADELQDISINVTTEGIGYADVNITVTRGDYVTLTAITNEGNNFIGWYENGTLVSTEAEYSFVAKENRNLVAKFTNNRTIQWNVDGEITVTYCEPGKTIAIPDAPEKDGCVFKGWSPEVPLTMSAEDLTFTAVFEKIGSDETPEEPSIKPEDPSTKPEEPSTKPEEPSTKPEEPSTKPEEPSTKPEEPSTKPEEPSTKPEEPSTKPEEPSTKPEEPSTKPEEPSTKPEEPSTKPEEPSTKPEEPSTKPEEPSTKPEEPSTKPEEPSTKPEEPSTKPEEPSTKPEEPSTKPTEHETKPSEPKFDAAVIHEPSVGEIKYGDSIVLHVDRAKIPENGYVKWDVSNECFSYSAAADGLTCKATPSTSGSTTFIATIYDEDGNAVLKDEQTLTSKAGFFQKIIAFFKGLFKLNKTYDEVL